METNWRPRLLPSEPTLGNFLSGMETGLGRLHPPAPRRLGNFLSGMETLWPHFMRLVGELPWKLP